MIFQDLLRAFRGIRRNPGFAAVAVLCLGLGIGVNTAIFSFVNFLVFRPIRLSRPEQLVRIYRGGEAASFHLSDYDAYRDGNQTMSGLAGTNLSESSLDFDGRSNTAAAETVTGTYGEVSQVTPLTGRWFRPDEDRPGGIPPMVISYRVWQSQFGGDPAILGRRVRAETQWYTIVGVAPKGFQGLFFHIATDIWVPVRAWAAQYDFPARLVVFGRLKPGVSLVTARTNLQEIEDHLSGKPAHVVVESAGTASLQDRRKASPILALLMGVVALVLLIACVNLANLLLARAEGRRRETALRFALGASAGQVARQVLAESAVLAVLGAGVGFVFSAWTNRALQLTLPMNPDLTPDYRVFLFTLAVTAAATLAFGLAPALHASRIDVMAGLRGEAQPARLRLVRFSIAGQVAFSLVLLFMSGAFLKALGAFRSADPGFETKGRLFAQVFISKPEYDATTGPAFYNRLAAFAGELPGSHGAGITSMLPFSYPIRTCAAVGGKILHPGSSVVDGGFLSAVGVRLLRGRSFLPSDGPGAPHVALVNEAMARQQWPGGDAIGQRIRTGAGCENGGGETAEIVGIAANSRWASLLEGDEPHLYEPLAQNFGGLATLVVNTGDESGARSEELRKQLRAFEPSLRVYGIRPLAEHVNESYWQVRFEAAGFGGFGTLALLLASAGLYGLIAYTTAQRNREIGIRLALGARQKDIASMVVLSTMRFCAVGIATGATLSLAVAQPMKALLYGLNPADPGILAGVAAIWLIMAAAASYLPARRAAAIDPLRSLRHE
jgi:predicted permease